MSAFNTVEEALEALRKGKLILVTDDPERENEGDFICAAVLNSALCPGSNPVKWRCRR